MAAIPLFGAGNSTTATAASGTGSALTVAKPANVAVGDLLIASFYSQFSGTVTSAPAGWTLIKAFASRSGGLYYLAVPDSTTLAGLPSTWSMTVSGSGRLCWDVFRVTGANLSTPIGVTGAEAPQSGSASITIPAVSPTNSNDLLIAHAYWNNSSTTQSTYTPDAAMTDGEQVKSPTTGNTSGIDLAYQQLSASGTTGTRTFSTSPTGASNSGVMFTIQAATGFSGSGAFSGSGTLGVTGIPTVTGAVALSGSGTLTNMGSPAVTGTVAASGTGTLGVAGGGGNAGTAVLSGSGVLGTVGQPSITGTAATSGTGSITVTGTPATIGAATLSGSGTLTAHAITPVDTWLASSPLNVAHFGGDADWPPGMTAFAYGQATLWNASMALEMSVWQTLDGVWVVSHDNTTDTLFGTSGVIIPNVNWSAISGLTTTVGGYPILRMIDMLAAYPSRVFFIENKGSQDVTNFFTLLGTYGGGARIVIKVAAGAMSLPTIARSNGYKIWAYGFQADAANWGTTSPYYDLLGMDYHANATAWSQTMAVGKPVLAHIVPTAAAKATAVGFGANGFMASGVQEVIPQTPAQLAFSGSGSLGGTGAPRLAGGAALSGDGTLATTGSPAIAGSSVFSGAGTLSATSTSFSGAALFTGAGTVVAAGVPHPAAGAAFSGGGVFTVTASPRFTGAISLAGAGTLLGGPSIPVQNITVTGVLAARRWAAVQVARTKSGLLAPHNKTGTLAVRSKTGALTPRRWNGTLR